MIATLAKSSYGWSPLWLHFPWTIANLVKSSYGWSPLWLNLPTDDRHFGYISHGRSPIWLNLPTDDRHFGYIINWPRTQCFFFFYNIAKIFTASSAREERERERERERGRKKRAGESERSCDRSVSVVACRRVCFCCFFFPLHSRVFPAVTWDSLVLRSTAAILLFRWTLSASHLVQRIDLKEQL